MTTSFKLALPVYNPERSYELFKSELELWDSITDLADEKRGVAIALSLPDNDKCHLRSTILEKVDKAKLKEKGGLKVLTELLDSLLKDDELEDSMRKYEEFEDYQRSKSETINQFCVNFEAKYDKIKNAGITLPPQVLAFKLLRSACISRDDKKLCLTGMDYTDKDKLFVQAVKSLKKYCGDGRTSGGYSSVSSSGIFSTSTTPSIKVEKSEDVLKVNASYGRGRNFQNQGKNAFWPHQRGRRGFSSQSNWRGSGPRGGYYQNQGRGKQASFSPNAYVSRGERPMNPVGDDGKPMLCKGCGSFRHFLDKCPESWENLKYNSNQGKVNYVEESQSGACADTESGEYDEYGYYDEYNYQYDYDNPEECHVVLYTGDLNLDRITLTTESQNCAVLDTACTKTVAGKEWFDTYVQSLSEEEALSIKYCASTCTFKFGAGPILPSLGQYKIPATLVGRNVMIVTDVVDTDIPLLLSKSAMKRACVAIDIANDTAMIFGNKVNLSLTGSGHYCVPLVPDYKVSEVFAVEMHSLSPRDQSRMILKLHRQFGHPPEPKLIELLKDANVWKDDYQNLLDRVYEKCRESGLCRFKRVVRPAVSMSLSKDFNEKVAMDLKSWNGKWILHIIDLWSRYTMSTFISRKRPSDVINAILTEWCGVFGFMKGLLTDNGGEFVSQEMLEVESILNLEVLSTAAESPFQNGVCERNHQVVDAILFKLTQDFPKTPINVLLKWACMAKNSLQMWSGYSSHQLVFGKNPNLPNFQVSSISSLEECTSSEAFAQHLNALHAARQAFIQTESCQKIKKALKCKVRTNEQVFNPGEKVHYKRENSERWLGPAKVIFQDGKIVFVRHGPIWVKVSLNNLAKVDKEFDTSRDQLVSNIMPSLNDAESSLQNDYPVESIISTQETVQAQPENIAPVPVHVENQDTVPYQDTVPAQEDTVPAQPDDQDTVPVQPDNHFVETERRSNRMINKELSSQIYMVTIPLKLQKTQECLDAKQVELKKLLDFGVYEEVPGERQQCISTRWVLWKKGDGVRARLVARGFEETMNEQVDSPTVGKGVMRILLAVASSFQWTVKSIDIKSAFLQGEQLDRDVYIIPPREANVTEGYVWKLKRCLYGLNDAARKFFDSVASELYAAGCVQSQLDPSLYFYHENSAVHGVIVSHIDDFLYAGTDTFYSKVIRRLCKRFLAGKLEEGCFQYVGYQIRQTERGIILDQNDYTENITCTPLPAVRQAQKHEKMNDAELTDYRALVGSLNWIVQGTRPDLSFVLVDFSTKFHNGNVSDYLQLQKVVQNAKVNKTEILYPCLGSTDSWQLLVFTDASHANLCQGVSSCMGYIVLLANEDGLACPIVWKSNKIRRVVRSTIAAEILACVEGIEHAMYVRNILLQMLLLNSEDAVPIIAFVDHQGAVESIHSTKLVEDKRLRIDIAAIKENITKKEIHEVRDIAGCDQLADCLTKRGASGEKLRAVLQQGSLNMVLLH